ncbi:MAG: trigger factor [Lachnospiraceae bacterium]|nr:trigger factor [Lachnospiraceae bacterium]
MSFEVKKLDGNMAELTITVPAADFDKALVAAYNKNKKKFSMPGFRKGKVPMTLIEKEYGAGVFYDDAANDLINETYPAELKAHEDLEVVSNPEIKVSQIEKGKDFIYVATVATKPAVELGDLEAIEVKVMDTTVTDEDVEAEIKRNLKQNSSKVDVTDRAAELEDETTIDFVGSVDGVEFEGGKGNDYPLVLGSGSFIPGFEDQIVGHSVGETFDVNVTFPEEYQAEDLAGKAAVFKTTIKAIKAINMPELDDAYVSDTTDFETVDEYKADVKKKLEEKKAADAKNDKENKAVDKLVEMSKMDIPEAMLRFQQEQMVRDFEQRLMYQGMNMDQYLQMTKQTREDMMEQVKPNAEKQIKSSLVVEAVANTNNIEVTDEDVDKKLEKMAKQYNMEVEKIKELVKEQLDNVRSDIKMQKAVELIASKAKEVK